MAERAHLTIGEVLTLLREEFPDVSISKIRFLESQGLVDPERTPSGYRKFYDHDVERLRWILRQQRENFLPLKVIKGRLADRAKSGGDPPGQLASGSDAPGGTDAPGADVAAPARSAASSTEPRGTTGRDEPAGATGPGDDRRSDLASSRQDGSDPAGARKAPVAEQVAPGGSAHDRARPAGPDPAPGPAPAPGEEARRDPRSTPVASHSGAEPLAALSGGGAGRYQDQVVSNPRQLSASDSGRKSPGDPPQPSASESPATGSPAAAATPAAATPVGAGAQPAPTAADPLSSRGGDDARSEPVRLPAGASASAPSGARPPMTPSSRPDAAPSRPGEPGAGRVEPVPASATGAGPLPPNGLDGPSGPEGSAAPDVYTTDELAAAAGCEPELVSDLQQYGLLTPNATVRGVAYFDPGAVAVARTAASFAELGVEPRHLRSWRTSADREISLFEQLVVPLLRQRNPRARQQAVETLGELARLGADLRAELVREGLARIR